MKKDKNKGKKTIAAVGAVVVAGLTPGIIAASAAGTALQAPNATVTAAEVVAIGGNTYDYDELYDMQQRADGPKQAKKKKEQRQQATRYGVPRPQHATYYGVPRPSGTCRCAASRASPRCIRETRPRASRRVRTRRGAARSPFPIRRLR